MEVPWLIIKKINDGFMNIILAYIGCRRVRISREDLINISLWIISR